MAHNRIFLSHKGVDKDLVREYHAALHSVGLNPWLDETELTAGAPLVRSLGEGMANSCAAVFFLSPDYKDVEFLRQEVDDAIAERVARDNGFAIISLAVPDGTGRSIDIPAPLKKYVWKTATTPLEGLRYIIEGLPKHIGTCRGYVPLHHVVPPIAKEVAILGQNLGSRLDEHKLPQFISETKALLRRSPNLRMILVMMTPQALKSIHPKAAVHLRNITLPALEKLATDLTGYSLEVVFHPSATLSMVAVDWSYPVDAFAVITVKFQKTGDVDDRTNVLIDETYFDTGSLTAMLNDARDKDNGAERCGLADAPKVLVRLLDNAEL